MSHRDFRDYAVAAKGGMDEPNLLACSFKQIVY